MKDFILALRESFEQHANPKIARDQEAYMKNNFVFYGIKSPVRNEIQKPFLAKDHLPPKKDLDRLIRQLWKLPQREYQLTAMDLAEKYKRQWEQDDIELFEFMVTHKSWWDSVDFISSHMMGAYFRKFPEKRKKYVKKWLASGNMWLQRSALLFQLGYKEETDTELLAYVIQQLLGSKEFFINKAIGWTLRQYGKTNPQWVKAFVKKTQLANLSKREALRLI